jgi:hypothetical protein
VVALGAGLELTDGTVLAAGAADWTDVAAVGRGTAWTFARVAEERPADAMPPEARS